MDISVSYWMDPWFTDFLVRTLLQSLFVYRSATHSFGCLWFLSRRSLIFLLLIALVGLLFLSFAMYSITWVCLGHNSHDEVSKFSEIYPWFGLVIKSPVISHLGHHSTDIYPLCILCVIKKYLIFMCFFAFTALILAVLLHNNSAFIVLVDNILSDSVSLIFWNIPGT